MNEKLAEFIAIGASTAAHCVPCLQFHYEKALEQGASVEEIREAIKIGRMVRKGAARTWDKEAAMLLGENSEKD
jgi:AhpD family alkylhydroperoxidase